MSHRLHRWDRQMYCKYMSHRLHRWDRNRNYRWEDRYTVNICCLYIVNVCMDGTDIFYICSEDYAGRTTYKQKYTIKKNSIKTKSFGLSILSLWFLEQILSEDTIPKTK